MAASQASRVLWIIVLASLCCVHTLWAQIPSPSDPSVSTDDTNQADNDTNPGADQPDKDSAISTSTGTPVLRLGTDIPLGMDPGGYRIGPVHVFNLGVSGFYETANPQFQSPQQFWGTSLSASLLYQHKVNNGELIIQGNPTLYSTGSSVYTNQSVVVDFNKQVTSRWTLGASAQYTFYQNGYLLQTPQYLLAYAAGGIVLQTIFAQQAGSTMYESTGFSMSYHLSGRTQISITPDIGVTFTDVVGKSYYLTQLGGGVSVTHSFNPSRTVSAFVNYNRSNTSLEESPGINAWNTYSVGVGFNQKLGQTWYVAATIAGSYQQGPFAYWTPTGSFSIMKVFRRGTVSAAYTRTTASQALLSSGYFDQSDLAYTAHIGKKIGTSVGVGEFRSIITGGHQHGLRAYSSLSYRWLPNLAWTVGYNYAKQTGTEPSLYLGNTSYFSVGLNWILGHPGR